MDTEKDFGATTIRFMIILTCTEFVETFMINM